MKFRALPMVVAIVLVGVAGSSCTPSVATSTASNPTMLGDNDSSRSSITPPNVVLERPSAPATSQAEILDVNEPQLRDKGEISVGSSAIAGVLSPDGSTLYVLDRTEEEVVVVDTLTSVVTRQVPSGSMPVGVALSRDGRTLAVSNSTDGSVSLIGTEADATPVIIPVGLRVGELAASPLRNRLFVIDEYRRRISIIDLGKQRVIRSRPIDWRGAPSALAFSLDGTALYLATGKEVQVLDPETLKTTKSITVGDEVYGIVSAPEEGVIYLRTANMGVVGVELREGQVGRSHLSGVMIKGIALSPRGDYLYASFVGGGIGVVAVNMVTSSLVSDISMSEIPGAIAVSSEGSRLYVLQDSAGLVVTVGTGL